ncbi:MAG: FAD-dependent monooxygenase [Limnohabitans sp.]|jgi:3-(3-hydroxy-phenyl)propionate hydroxylase|nr:FAD-dependent monooxygenase [Limnohabitans sp.]
MQTHQAHVVVAGAGPVGLVSALLLANQGVKVTVLEAAPALNRDLRASTFHPPTLDMLAPLGLTDDLVAQGLVARYTQQRDRQEGVIAEFDMQLIAPDTDHPFRLQCEQWKLTQMIQAQLNAMPHVQILFDAKVTQVTQSADQVQVAFTQAEEAHSLQADYLIGADGAWSAVRRSLNIEFEGFTYPERFLVVSTAFEYADHLPRLSYVNYCSDPQEWCVLLRVPTLWRVLFPTKAEETDEAVLTDESVQARLQNLLPQAQPYVTQHRTLYKVHQRVAQRFRHGRVVLAGDAAHINNPLGGMGMNGGIHDAMNLSEKLLAVLQKGESDAVLDQYERQRRTIAIDYINASTARNKRDIEERDPVKRKENQQALRELSLDPVRARAYIRQSSMIDALERAKAIA